MYYNYSTTKSNNLPLCNKVVRKCMVINNLYFQPILIGRGTQMPLNAMNTSILKIMSANHAVTDLEHIQMNT